MSLPVAGFGTPALATFGFGGSAGSSQLTFLLSPDPSTAVVYPPQLVKFAGLIETTDLNFEFKLFRDGRTAYYGFGWECELWTTSPTTKYKTPWADFYVDDLSEHTVSGQIAFLDGSLLGVDAVATTPFYFLVATPTGTIPITWNVQLSIEHDQGYVPYTVVSVDLFGRTIDFYTTWVPSSPVSSPQTYTVNYTVPALNTGQYAGRVWERDDPGDAFTLSLTDTLEVT